MTDGASPRSESAFIAAAFASGVAVLAVLYQFQPVLAQPDVMILRRAATSPPALENPSAAPVDEPSADTSPVAVSRDSAPPAAPERPRISKTETKLVPGPSGEPSFLVVDAAGNIRLIAASVAPVRPGDPKFVRRMRYAGREYEFHDFGGGAQ